MKQGITVQERLKDLRTERHLKLEELAAVTGISKSALGSYENDELKEISHKNLVELAKFYGVATAHFQNFNMCTQLQIRYEKLSEQERTVLKNVMKKTPAYKDSPLSRMKRREGNAVDC